MVAAALVGGVAVGAIMGGDSPDIPPPDPSVGRAQEKMADLATRQQDYYEGTVSPMLMEQIKQQTAIAKRTSDAESELANFQTEESKKMSGRYWGVQVPQEDKLIAEANAYNERAEQERMAGQAGADVTQQGAIAQQGLSQSLRARGVGLGSPAAVSAMTEMNTQLTLAKAGAVNKTRETARQMGWTRLGEVAALGRNLPGFGTTSASVASNANMGAVSAGAAGVNAAGAAGSSSQQQLGSQMGAWGGYGNLGVQTGNYNLGAAKLREDSDPTNAILGAAAGYGMSYLGGQYGGKKK